MTTPFHIKPGYQENPGPAYFLDDVTSTRGLVFQPDVYTFAELLGSMNPRSAGDEFVVVDVGCGWADKLEMLRARRPNWRLVGVDFGPNIDHCVSAFPWGRWLEVDLEHAQLWMPAGADLVICSDVIEHLADPTMMLRSLAASGAMVVLSTPERDVQYGYDHMGPSSNLCHVREWSAAELHSYLEAAGFEIYHHGLTRGVDESWVMPTQLVVMRGVS